ncbi:hypothetical protein JW964_02585 [candidate division KSB1 bacterium]|nr:hypothetical protein [candidate division KSB1 bacterium]
MTQIRTVDKADYEKLSRFLANFQNEQRDQTFWQSRFQLWWDQNPAYSESIIRGWIILDSEQIVGFLGNVPSFLQLFNYQVTVYSSTTWRVLPEYRDKSLSLLYQQMNIAKDTLLFNTTPNKTVKEILHLLKFKKLPSSIDTEWVFLINFQKVIQKLFQKKTTGDSVHSMLARWLSRPGGFILSIYQLFRMNRFRNLRLKNVQSIARADSRFDDLWERTRYLYANTNIRTAAVINWYCFDNQLFNKIVFGYFNNDQLLGYAIFVVDKELNTLKCFDLWYDPDEEHIIPALVSYARKYAIENSYDSIRFPFFNQSIGNLFDKFGLFKSRSNEKKNYFKCKSDIDEALTEENSYFVLAQGDLGL